ncbi:MAG: DUF4363 family protein [Clostridia bacterium]|nr:DUF4363 family protein [Clostridia bacterium]
MKGFYTAIAAFIVLVALIVCNAIYIHDTAKEIGSQLDTSFAPAKAEEAIIELEAYWKARRGIAELTVPSRVIWEIDDRLCELRVAASQKDAESFATALSLLKTAVQRLAEAEQFSIGNLL